MARVCSTGKGAGYIALSLIEARSDTFVVLMNKDEICDQQGEHCQRVEYEQGHWRAVEREADRNLSQGKQCDTASKPLVELVFD